jgi:hypothetical protein
MTTNEKINPNKTARIAGILYLLVAVLGIFNMMYGPSSLIVLGDAATTVNNIMASESLFRLGIVNDLAAQTVGILLVLFLYKLLKPVSKTQASLMVIFALVGIPIVMLNLLNQFAALLLLSGADYLTVFAADQLQALVMLFLNLDEHGFMIAHIFWGLWLFPMGYLVFKSGYIPRILGILLIIAGFGYLIDFVTFFFFPSFGPIKMFTFIGELLLPLWLLIKGVNVEQWEKRAHESA